jgi:hypothetical protein
LTSNNVGSLQQVQVFLVLFRMRSKPFNSECKLSLLGFENLKNESFVTLQAIITVSKFTLVIFFSHSMQNRP